MMVKGKQRGIKCQQIDPTRGQLPSGLVGSTSTADVTVEGLQCSCLIDTGTQVTMLSKSFHDNSLPSHPILLLGNLLEVEEAAGQIVPYLGFVEIDILSQENLQRLAP